MIESKNYNYNLFSNSNRWFGNLVTPKWWNDIWLKEGFARYAEHLVSNAIKPTWRMVLFIINYKIYLKILLKFKLNTIILKFDRLYDLLVSVIQLDSIENTRPVSLIVNTPEEIDANYSPTITYGKVGQYFKFFIEYLKNILMKFKQKGCCDC